jgi:hypothetical protein
VGERCRNSIPSAGEEDRAGPAENESEDAEGFDDQWAGPVVKEFLPAGRHSGHDAALKEFLPLIIVTGPILAGC